MSAYENLPTSAFWKTAVADTPPESAEGLYKKKYDISKSDNVATAGSCFAQHIARHMRQCGFNVLDVEPAPTGISNETAQKFGYGIYSARYANIYYARQLLQLFFEAFGLLEVESESWEKDGRYYDAFRPSVEPHGLGSIAEVAEHRAVHLAAVRRLFKTADIFIFTLGLTEGWMNRETEVVYPTAPGTLAGVYDPNKYVFKNFTYPEIARDLRQFRLNLKRINPKVKILLTVSPVPLTATASGNHVLPATLYSKSVLRAVAQDISNQFEDVDYFPSYDLIASHWSGGRFYNDNLRTVRDVGVECAMRTFLEEHDPDYEKSSTNIQDPSKSSVSDDDGDLICEEMLLEAFAK